MKNVDQRSNSSFAQASRRDVINGLGLTAGVASSPLLSLAGQTHFVVNSGRSLLEFGARPEAEAAVNWQALLKAVEHCRREGCALRIPAERFEMEPPAGNIGILDLTRKVNGARRAIPILGQGGPAGSNLFFRSSGLRLASIEDWFDPILEGFSITGNIAGPLLEIGRPDFKDPVNLMRIRDISVENSSSLAHSSCVVLNYIAPGSYAIGLKCNGFSDGRGRNGGTALLCRQVECMTFVGGAAGNAAIGLRIVDGFNFGLSFTGLTFENCNVAVSHESQFSGGHAFQGCQFSNITQWSIQSSSAITSEWIEFSSCNFTAQGAMIDPARCEGVRIRDRSGIKTPGVPPSGERLRNTTGRSVNIFIYSGAISGIAINEHFIDFDQRNQNIMINLIPGQNITLFWSKIPSWFWQNSG